jgi:hypothetical protein
LDNSCLFSKATKSKGIETRKVDLHQLQYILSREKWPSDWFTVLGIHVFHEYTLVYI